MYMKFKDFLNGFNCIKWLHICDLLKQVCLHRIYIILKKKNCHYPEYVLLHRNYQVFTVFTVFIAENPQFQYLSIIVKLVYKEHL